MDISMLKAYIEGYQDHLFDLKCIAVYQGFWAGYYGNAKKPKSITSVLETLNREHQKAKKQRRKKVSVSESSSKVDVDVDAFLAMERRRLKVKQK